MMGKLQIRITTRVSDTKNGKENRTTTTAGELKRVLRSLKQTDGVEYITWNTYWNTVCFMSDGTVLHPTIFRKFMRDFKDYVEKRQLKPQITD